MGKKCIPGVFCIENMTLFIILLIFLFCVFFFFMMMHSSKNLVREITIDNSFPPPSLRQNIPIVGLAKTDVFSDPYFPPLKDNIGSGVYYPRNFTDIRGGISLTRGVPINIETQPTASSFNQVGILTRSGNINGELILPVFGRNLFSNRDKWQYYTLSNTGNISSKLPIRFHGKDGMSEYGIDEITNGDVVYVQGYNDIFIATIYDSRGISYIPYL